MILITGATGLAGSHLTYHLVKEGYAVRLLVRNKQKIAQLARTFAYYNASLDDYNSQIDYTTGDVTDIFSLEEAFSVTQYDNSKIQQTLNTQIEGIRKAIAFTAECFLKDYQ